MPMPHLLSPFTAWVRRQSSLPRNKRILDALDRSDAPAVKAIGQAVRQRLTDAQWTAEEEARIRAVENYRARLLASTETFEVVDYGAHGPDADRNRNEMETGIRVGRSVAALAKGAASPPFWGQCMFSLVRALRPGLCLELGTSLGISASYQSAALKLNGKGRLISIEGDPSIARIATAGLKEQGYTGTEVRCGRFMDVLPTLLRECGPLDFIFIDGHHDHEATKEYFDMLLPHMAPNAVVIFDDIRWSPGMFKAWEELCSDPRTGYVIDLGRWGLACIGAKKVGPAMPEKFELG